MPAVVQTMPSHPGPMDSTPSTDKKRNKLGYHRTSVACVHCRRRKIRCLVAADDAQGRCENCIRLRKECQFFPVDQQPPVEKKTRPNSRLDSSASTDPSTASSSPPIISGPLEQPQHQHQHQQPETFFYQPMPLNAAQNVHGLPQGPLAGNIPPFASDRNPGEFGSAPLDSPVPWDEFTTISDPQMLATLNAAKPQSAMIDLSPTSVWSGGDMGSMPSNASLQATPTVPSQQPAQAFDIATTTPTFTMPDGTVWHVPPQPTRSMTFPAQPDMAASYPPPPVPATSTPTHFAPPMDPDPKQSASPAADPMQTMTMSMSYPGTQVPGAMGYPVWPDASGMAAMNVVSYPVFSPEGPQQGTPFRSPPPTGHPAHSPQG